MRGRRTSRCCCGPATSFDCEGCTGGTAPLSLFVTVDFGNIQCFNCPTFNGTYELTQVATPVDDQCRWAACFPFTAFTLCTQSISGLEITALFDYTISSYLLRVQFGYKFASFGGCSSIFVWRTDTYAYNFGSTMPDCFDWLDLELTSTEIPTSTECQGTVTVTSG